MPLSSELQSITGAQELHDWFGFWPDFHDAEVIRFHLNRSGPSYLAIHTWEMNKQIDSKGHYELAKHVVVEFILDEVSNLGLDGFSSQNVISSLGVERLKTGFRLVLGPCFGLSGSIEAERLSIRVSPGRPSASPSS